MSISEIAVKRPLLVTTIFTVLILFGVLSYQQLSYNLLPKFEANVISVATVYRGASADEVETNVPSGSRMRCRRWKASTA